MSNFELNDINDSEFGEYLNPSPRKQIQIDWNRERIDLLVQQAYHYRAHVKEDKINLKTKWQYVRDSLASNRGFADAQDLSSDSVSRKFDHFKAFIVQNLALEKEGANLSAISNVASDDTIKLIKKMIQEEKVLNELKNQSKNKKKKTDQYMDRVENIVLHSNSSLTTPTKSAALNLFTTSTSSTTSSTTTPSTSSTISLGLDSTQNLSTHLESAASNNLTSAETESNNC